MKHLIIFTLLYAGNIWAFDYSSYELRDAEEIYQESKNYDPDEKEGQSVLTPALRIHLYEKIYRFPEKCDAFLATSILKVGGIPKDSIPPINYCMSIETSKGNKIGLYVQDSIARFVEEEYEIGDKMHLWTLWIFVNSSDKKPYFVVNAIGE